MQIVSTARTVNVKRFAQYVQAWQSLQFQRFRADGFGGYATAMNLALRFIGDTLNR